MEDKIHQLLWQVGASQTYVGYRYLYDAVLIACQNQDATKQVVQNIYVPLSKKYGISVSSLGSYLCRMRTLIYKRGGLDCPNPPAPKDLIRILADRAREMDSQE